MRHKQNGTTITISKAYTRSVSIVDNITEIILIIASEVWKLQPVVVNSVCNNNIYI